MFIGTWAYTFFTLGAAPKLEEDESAPANPALALSIHWTSGS
jgi:hypothetical protein